MELSWQQYNSVLESFLTVAFILIGVVVAGLSLQFRLRPEEYEQERVLEAREAFRHFMKHYLMLSGLLLVLYLSSYYLDVFMSQYVFTVLGIIPIMIVLWLLVLFWKTYHFAKKVTIVSITGQLRFQHEVNPPRETVDYDTGDT